MSTETGHLTTDTSHIHVDRKEYWFIFGMLSMLTALEVAVVYVPGIAKGLLISALTLMALAKAGLVGLFFHFSQAGVPALPNAQHGGFLRG